MKTIKIIFYICLSVILLSGCTLLIKTKESTKSRTVIITPKRQNIINVSKININFGALKLSSEDKKEQYDILYKMIVQYLRQLGTFFQCMNPA